MKYIGFIKEYNKIPESFSLNEYKSKQNYANEEKEKILHYLKKGDVILTWMGVFLDLDNNNFIGPQIYYTDGEWIWPLYLIYYLEKEIFFDLEEEFTNYLKERKYKLNILSEEKLREIEYDFSDKLERYL
ncbi:hypothetical protein [Chryseobacterium rhizosphaerae]|uniref:Uncharacterized protein n=1 Tax=Chryseobacterium rhizosphaerae TaxID=395937 RepID=A0AAE3YDM4_9FLAO|nr:hypothetical protein [Chryseobacterium rhizosphaerae]MDR6528465.1 hypothetical protein [Chryseobacterium rhizosphaerae]REC68705.1 hypothetical protein DRF57_23340 [Chryseobacterium rhizosphaerae]GEN69683.1 hypothetical protein CRH01_42510 [Chryseobacterium rhizosphaerae]